MGDDGPGLPGDVDEPFARPFLLTGGRTGGGRAGIGIETVLVRGAGPTPTPARPGTANLLARSPELTQIISACERPVAVAEVAARVGLPIGVVQVLTGDLVEAGVLIRSQPSTDLADDVLFIERLINGVAAL